ncbi:bifunctional folylpolyglutamate synthase/dihydrofolate synthase [Alkalibacterium pelagium]|uniref:tetrahydrofolate synthase n=1 Tax=Alkalibacterium pelagium TaxID=426702 RepID=A0A1H7I7S8_9LACT|nr:folylpolyglutamate synthase/dihydrofolate synthase family protein [Alkalibacterium pelagium]GEN49995.1 bifunctional folylpolyglutamate synthase/dihydrofolate synthase [Alkalibacterium pelagium]SEK58579.1 dihydrofolate synthase / folylpolyglutamate synthase [Alkalibacterium pelagium]
MNMTEVIELVNTNRGTGQKENLNRMRLLMNKLGDPQDRLRVVHIAGTNGKGSVSAFLSSILSQAGIKAGVYTSPHLESINERIKVSGQMITDEEFIEATETVAPFVAQVEEETGERLYSFEILTAVALLHFAVSRCDLVILETGIGGRLDATNVVNTSEASIITSIGYDHMKVLGDTIEQITAEKSGIIKENGLVIFPEMSEEVDAVISRKAENVQADMIRVTPNHISSVSMTDTYSSFSYKEMDGLIIHLLGRHQITNAALAVEAAQVLEQRGFVITSDHIRKGLELAAWPGRMEKISEHPTILIDGAHNPEGVAALRENISYLFPDEQLIFVVGMMKDKAYEDMIEQILPFSEKILTVSPDPYRGFDAEGTADWLDAQGQESQAFKSVDELIVELKSQSYLNRKVIVFGSLYLIGDMRRLWKK